MLEHHQFKTKYQVFLSSTFKDLKPHREAATLGVVSAGHMVTALENYPPSSKTRKSVIESTLASCQYYVIILGARYGNVPADQEPAAGKSFVEIEYDMAQHFKLQTLAFVIEQGKLIEYRKSNEWQLDKDEVANAGRYDAFRKRLSDGLNTIYTSEFSEPAEIKSALHSYFSQPNETKGYRLEPNIESDVDVLQVYAKNEVVRDVITSVVKSKDADEKLTIAAGKKKCLAEAFDELFGDHLTHCDRLFLESGSTITYVAKYIKDRLPKRGTTEARKPEVLTNNAFAYLYLWLCAGVLCHPIPEGPPDDRYAGVYGPLTNLRMKPSYDLRPLADVDYEASRLILELAKEMFGAPDQNKKTLIIGAISGLQLDDNVLVDRSANVNVDDDLLQRLKECRGFHVGSYPNMLFKRSYYSTGIPAIIFMHDDKINCPIRVDRCHFLFDHGYPWNTFASEYPLSVWVCCEASKRHELLTKLQTHFDEVGGGWTLGIYGAACVLPIVIGFNKAFVTACGQMGITLPHFEVAPAVATR